MKNGWKNYENRLDVSLFHRLTRNSLLDWNVAKRLQHWYGNSAAPHLRLWFMQAGLRYSSVGGFIIRPHSLSYRLLRSLSHEHGRYAS
ncbi:hypothetical protein [Bradyrhizobium uaiense]|uniref:Uncharacterized protein n=1 Tax=Bradyrhizobium uaiense TaxID=2594946 RepID=A0A6P1BUI8_9BRAD|nr:hypothetical protein [Bradyrhizobium uaiense]NEV01361.1 hypothetical protein [Bradyrhizobium uaiense]